MRAIGEWTRRDAALAAVGVAGVAWMALTPVHNYDVWHHMRMGRYMLETRSIPLEDIFSYNARHPWINPAWFADIGMDLLWRAAGPAGLILAKTAAVAAAWAVLALTCRFHGLSAASTIALLALTGLAAKTRFLCRPLVLAFPLLALESYLLRKWRREGDDRLLLAAPALALAWANVHASFPLSVVLAAFAAGGAAVDAGRRFWTDRRVRLAGLTVVVCAAACFVSPFTWRQVAHALTLPERRGLTRHPTEWMRMPFSLQYFTPGSPHFLSGYAWFWILLAAGAALFLKTRRRIDWPDLAMFLFFAALGLSARRHTALFAVGAAPALARQLRWLGRFRTRRRERLAGAAAALAAALLAAPTRIGLGVDWTLYPVRCLDYVIAQNVDGRMFNRWGWGSYIIWRCWPQRLVFADGRLEVYDPDVYADHDRVLNAEPGWSELLEKKYDVDYLIVPHNPRVPNAYVHPRWKLVFWDRTGLVFVRDEPRFRALIARDECGLTQPTMFETYRRRPEVVPLLQSALERFVRRRPDCLVARRHLAALYLQLRDYAAAVREYERVAAAAPKEAVSHHDLGLAYLMAGRRADARRELRRALQLKPDRAAARSARRLLQRCSRRETNR